MRRPDDDFAKLYDIIIRLRSPDGCPWDREQTPLSLRGALIEETYECVEAIDQRDPAHIKEELGDIFLLITMISCIHEEEGLFSAADVLEGICEKLVRRHPHVFTDAPETKNLTSAEVLQNWARIKTEIEGRGSKDSILDEVGRGLPPLDRAWKLQKKAARAGFDWPDPAGVIAKIREELEEAEAVIAAGKKEAALEEELGDLLFSAVNLCRFFDIEPSVALQRTNIKFTERFRHVEKRMKENGLEMNARNLAVMDQYWNEAKNVNLS
jgi:tetrapyrrole methylase family protein/MazG family protein